MCGSLLSNCTFYGTLCLMKLECDLICSPFCLRLRYRLSSVLITSLNEHTLPKQTLKLNEGKTLIRGLIGLYPKQLSEPRFAFVTSTSSAVVRSERFACVLCFAACRCCVIANKDALGLIVYTYLIIHLHYWLLSDLSGPFTLPPALRCHTSPCTAYR